MTTNLRRMKASVLMGIAAMFLWAVVTGTGVHAQPPPADGAFEIDYLKGLSLEDLLQTEIISASKKSEPLFDAASAVFVITQEDLRRTGARNIPEALRMVPGLQVAHIDANRWAITARGFADWFSNKLLVMIDGRSVYSPSFSGVYWDVQDVIMADIDRIEVIRGPGATVWGANAVNGVVNIITKNASDTHGGLVNVGVGIHERPLVEARYGGRVAESADVRIFAKGFQREAFQKEDDGDAHDAWQNLQTGFRADWTAGARDDFILDGRIYSGEADMTLDLSGYLTPPYTRITRETETFSGGHLLSRWSRRLSATSDLSVQAYYDTTQRDMVVIEETRDTLDTEFKHHWNPAGPHDLVWGMGYRWTRDDFTGTYSTWMEPDSRSDSLWSAFVQDDITLVTDRLWLTLGSKFEYNDYSGFEIQPSARARYRLRDGQMLWAAVSHAVRTPSRSDHDLRANRGTFVLPSGDIAIVRLMGDDDFDSEELIAYEAGYRWQPQTMFSVDLTAFYNDYEQLRYAVLDPVFWENDPPPAHLVIPDVIANSMEGQTYGFEALATWRPLDIWRLSVSYAWLEMDLRKTGAADNGDTPTEQEMAPDHQVQVRSYLDLPWQLHLDAELYFVDQLASLDIDAYTRVDLRLEWTPSPRWTVSVGVENLLDDGHLEFVDSAGIVASEVPRTVYGQMTLNF